MRRGVFSLILLLASLPTGAEDFDDTYSRANKFFGAGFPLIAWRLYEDALSEATSDSQRINALGGFVVSAQELCAYKNAKEGLGAILSLDPGNNWAAKRREQLLEASQQDSCEMRSDLATLKQRYSFTNWPKNLDALQLIADEKAYIEAPMRFFCFAPCFGNSEFCSPYILATGTITEDTPSAFEQALEGCPAERVALNSPGGSLLAGMQLGRIIRDKGLDTGVGWPNQVEYWFKERESKESVLGNPTLIQKPHCLSACAYAFLGGTERWISENATYGVHQFRSDKLAFNETESQTVVGAIGTYLRELGVNRDLLQFALLTGPRDIYVLDRDELEELAVVTYKRESSTPWTLEALEEGMIAAKIQAVDAYYTARHTAFILTRDKGSFRALLVTRIQEEIMSQTEYVQQCREFIDEGGGSNLTVQVDDWKDIFDYSYKLTNDGTFVVWFSPSAQAVELMASEKPVKVTFATPNVCRPFGIRLPRLSTEKQRNSIRAIIGR